MQTIRIEYPTGVQETSVGSYSGVDDDVVISQTWIPNPEVKGAQPVHKAWIGMSIKDAKAFIPIFIQAVIDAELFWQEYETAMRNTKDTGTTPIEELVLFSDETTVAQVTD